MIIADFDCCFERRLQEMEAKVRDRGARASELTAWAHINMTALRQWNAEALQMQWIKGRQKLDKKELNDIPKLIQKVGKFDNTNKDSEFRSNG